MTTTDEQVWLSPEQAALRLSIGRTGLFALLRDGSIPSLTVGRRRMIPLAGLRAYAARAEAEALGRSFTTSGE